MVLLGSRFVAIEGSVGSAPRLVGGVFLGTIPRGVPHRWAMSLAGGRAGRANTTYVYGGLLANNATAELRRGIVSVDVPDLSSKVIPVTKCSSARYHVLSVFV